MQCAARIQRQAAASGPSAGPLPRSPCATVRAPPTAFHPRPPLAGAAFVSSTGGGRARKGGSASAAGVGRGSMMPAFQAGPDLLGPAFTLQLPFELLQPAQPSQPAETGTETTSADVAAPEGPAAAQTAVDGALQEAQPVAPAPGAEPVAAGGPQPSPYAFQVEVRAQEQLLRRHGALLVPPLLRSTAGAEPALLAARPPPASSPASFASPLSGLLQPPQAPSSSLRSHHTAPCSPTSSACPFLGLRACCSPPQAPSSRLAAQPRRAAPRRAPPPASVRVHCGSAGWR